MTGTWRQLLDAGFTRVTWPGRTGYLDLHISRDGIHYTPHDEKGKVALPLQQKYGRFADRSDWIGVEVEQEK